MVGLRPSVVTLPRRWTGTAHESGERVMTTTLLCHARVTRGNFSNRSKNSSIYKRTNEGETLEKKRENEYLQLGTWGEAGRGGYRWIGVRYCVRSVVAKYVVEFVRAEGLMSTQGSRILRLFANGNSWDALRLSCCFPSCARPSFRARSVLEGFCFAESISQQKAL